MYNVIVGKWNIWNLSSFMDGAEFQGRRTAKFMDFHAFNSSNIAFPRIKQVFQINPMAYSYNFMSISTLKLTKTLEKTGITSSIIKTDFEDVNTGVLLASRYVKVVGMNTSTRKPVRNPDWYIDKYSYLKDNNVPPELTEKSVIPKFPIDCFIYQTIVRLSDLDFNFHTNQSVYLKMCIDCASAASSSGKLVTFSGDMCWYPLLYADITYIGESFAGDTLDICVWQEEIDPSTLKFLVLKNEREITYAIFKFSLNKRNAKL